MTNWLQDIVTRSIAPVFQSTIEPTSAVIDATASKKIAAEVPQWVVSVRASAGQLFPAQIHADVLLTLVLSAISIGLLTLLLYDLSALGLRCCRIGLVTALIATFVITLSTIVTLSMAEFSTQYTAGAEQVGGAWHWIAQMARQIASMGR